MTAPPRTIVHDKGNGPRALAPGVTLDHVQPGGRIDPQRHVDNHIAGGQAWSDFFMVGCPDQPFQMLVPDIRLPPNQYWPLHWHDCWIAIVILDGSCLVGDWWMQPGDVLISEAGLEYGPLVSGPEGVQLFEIFARMHEQAGGYGEEYRDHPTLQGVDTQFMPRSERNRGNAGHSVLPVDDAPGLSKGHIGTDARWDLGGASDAERGIVASTILVPGESWATHFRDDWHGLFLLDGAIECAGEELAKNSVLITAPDSEVSRVTAGTEGARLLECARTASAMERRAR